MVFMSTVGLTYGRISTINTPSFDVPSCYYSFFLSIAFTWQWQVRGTWFTTAWFNWFIIHLPVSQDCTSCLESRWMSCPCWSCYVPCWRVGYTIVLGRSLMIGWRKKSWNHERVPSVVTLCVCPCVCPSVNELQVTPFDLGTQFLGRVVLRTWEKNVFFVFRNFHFYAFYRHFSIFSLYNTSKFLVSSFWSQFFT